MSPRFFIVIGAIFLIAFILLGIGRCGYKEIDSMSSLAKKSEKIRKEFPDIEHVESDVVAALAKAREVSPLLLVDCRSAEEFAVSHLAGAVNLETTKQVHEYLGSLSVAPKSVVIYCSVGQRSAVLTEELQRSKVKGVKNFVGSIFAWANEDRPLVDSKGEPAEKVHTYNEFWGRLVKENHRAPLK